MKVRTSIHAAIALNSITAIIFFIPSLNAHALGRESGSSNRQLPTPKPEWLEGSGKDLRIKIAGNILNEEGTPANGGKLDVRLETRLGEQVLPVEIKGDRFEFWVPLGTADWFTLHVNATSADRRQIARKMVVPYEIRQSAIEGLTLRLKTPERSVEVTVAENGRGVPDAWVAAEIEGERITGKTNEAGVATFPVMKLEKLSQLTAWTEDFKVGGYSFYRDPPRDPLGDKFTIELEKCRSQPIRILNEDDQTPAANLDFVLTIGTGAPDYQYAGKTPDCELKTDKNGEAVCRRFPDWKKTHCYIQIPDPHWVNAADAAMVDGTLVFKVRKGQFDKRKPVVGTVKSADGNVAGFFVDISSFQGEEKDHSDMFHAFTDERGRFTADYLPGATYCICINDVRLVSNIIDLIPYEPTTDKTNSPSLDIFAGRPVEIIATAGPERRPIARQYINLSTRHDYSWREDGMTRNGCGGRRWGVTTDEHGQATTFALPGKKIEGSLYTSQWRAQESVEVKTDGVTRLAFHRNVAAKRKIAGRLLAAEGIEADLQDAVVEIGSIDGETNERLTLKADAEGKFEFESQASQIGIYARTKDAKAAAVALVDRLDEPLEVRLKPTGEYRGQLLGKEDRPLQGHAVHAALHVSGKRDYTKPNPTGFSAATFASKTDDAGNYTLTGLPYEATLNLYADSLDHSDPNQYLGEFYLVPHESRPLDVGRLWSKPEAKIPFAERYARILRDCRLGHFHAMVIFFRPSDDAKRFVDVNLMDYEKTEEVSSFMQLQGHLDDEPANAEIAAFAESKSWPAPEKGKVLACAIDAAGNELGRKEFDPQDPNGPQSAAEFVRQFAPSKEDAIKKWDAAFATAKQSNRKVWVRISQRYCGPCFRLARWLDEHQEVLERDYVFLKIDDCRDAHGFEVAKRLSGDEHYGVPFHAIFDPDAHMLITSASPMGNIGFPSGFEGKKHLRKMLTETHTKLTDKQIDELVDSLSD